MRAAIAALAVLACVVGASAPWAQSSSVVTEAETGQSFPVSEDLGGAAHTLIGVGAFEAFGVVNVYGAGFYVESDAGGRAWQRFLGRQGAAFVTGGQVNWAGLKDSNTLYQWIVSGSFGKGIWIKMVHDVTRQQVIDLHEDVMRRLVDDFDNVVKQSPLKDYVDATCRDGHAGGEMRIWSRGSTIFVRHGDEASIRIENASSIIRAVWGLWFGAYPIQVPLRRGLVNNVENLGGPAAAE